MHKFISLLSDPQGAGLLFASVTIAVLHAIMPNHWIPFVLVARARKWTPSRLMVVTLAASSLHVLSTILVGLAVSWFGMGLADWLEGGAVSVAGLVLILIGIIYVVIHFMSGHHHHDDYEISDKVAISSLILMLTFSPCEAILPIFFIASQRGWEVILFISIILAVTTVISVVTFVSISYHWARDIQLGFFEEREHLFLGMIFAALGIIILYFH